MSTNQSYPKYIPSSYTFVSIVATYRARILFICPLLRSLALIVAFCVTSCHVGTPKMPDIAVLRTQADLMASHTSYNAKPSNCRPWPSSPLLTTTRRRCAFFTWRRLWFKTVEMRGLRNAQSSLLPSHRPQLLLVQWTMKKKKTAKLLSTLLRRIMTLLFCRQFRMRTTITFIKVCGCTSVASLIHFIPTASDGQPLFLHPLCSKILLQEFSSHAAFPPTLTARVIEIDRFMQSEVALMLMLGQ